MSKRHIVGIDPGSSSGALCFFDTMGELPMLVRNMPEGFREIYEELESQLGARNVAECHVVMENVGGSMPGNSAKSSRTFAEHVGALKMALVALGVSNSAVLPRKWMFELFGADYPSGMDNKDKRKQYIYEQMEKIHPMDKFTKRQADAVAIAWWAYKFGQVESGKE